MGLLEKLIQVVEEYNEVQPNEDFTLDWWNDVIDTLRDRNDEEEIETIIEVLERAIAELK